MAYASMASSQSVSLSKRYCRLDEGKGLGAISRGTLGKVYVAVDTLTEETVAVKRQVLPSDAASRELLFYSALSQYPHPSVMRMRSHFISDANDAHIRCLYLVFDFMETTLWDMWKKRRRLLPLAAVQNFLGQLAAGVGHLHHCGIAHTDLSMANLLVARSGVEPRCGDVVCIADLGGAISAEGMVLAAGKVVSTEYIRAPEAILGSAS